jgi:hypothetical protein
MSAGSSVKRSGGIRREYSVHTLFRVIQHGGRVAVLSHAVLKRALTLTLLGAAIAGASIGAAPAKAAGNLRAARQEAS